MSLEKHVQNIALSWRFKIINFNDRSLGIFCP